MIEKLKLFIKNKTNQDVEIISIFRTGSHLFCSNCNDIDYKVIVKEDIPILRYFDNDTNEDYFIYSQRDRHKALEFNDSNWNSIFSIDELFKNSTLVYGDSTINLDLLSKETEYKEMLRNVLSKWWFNKYVKWNNYELYCHRQFWWVIVGLKFIENKSYEITNELNDIIQLCHDGILPKYWETWVKEQLEIK